MISLWYYVQIDDVFDFLYSNVSQPSVATDLRCAGTPNNRFVRNVILSPTVKEFGKSVNNFQSYG